MAQQTTLARGKVEFVSEFSMMVPLTVVSVALGVPAAELENYKRWSTDSVKTLAGRVTHQKQIEAARAGVELGNFLAAQVEKARTGESEGLRYDSPIQALGRFVTQDTELGGHSIPAGSRVMVMYGRGNRDDGVFTYPDQFSIERKNDRRHIAFGAGPHYCVGASLARLESRIAMEHWFERIKNVRLVVDKNDFKHQYNFIFRALRELHLEFDAR